MYACANAKLEALASDCTNGSLATAPSMKRTISVDAKFSSFEELGGEIDKYQRKNYVQLYRRDSRTIETAIYNI